MLLGESRKLALDTMFLLDPTSIVLALLVLTLVVFVCDLARYDLVALGVACALVLTGVLDAEQAFAGFASEAVILIACMFVFSHAFSRCGVAKLLSRAFLRGTHSGERGLVARITVLSGLLSAVLSNTAVVATMIPVCNGVSRRKRISLSRILMPMAFGSLLGGLVTVIATSTNLVVNQSLRDAGVEPFGMFDFSLLGLILLGVGSLYLVGPGRKLLPRSPVGQSLSERYQVPRFVTEILVEPSSSLINRSVADVEVLRKHGVTVLGLVRAHGESPILAPGPYNRIRADDTLILQGSPEDILALSEELPLRQKPEVEAQGTRLVSDDVLLVEALIPAGSSLVGSSLKTAEFRTRSGLNVVAISKTSGVQLARLNEVELEMGDTLLLQGHMPDIERAGEERDVIMLSEIAAPRFGSKGWITVGTLAAILLVAALSHAISLGALALLGVLTLIGTKAVRADDAYRSVDWSVLALVGGMLALGRAFQQEVLTPEQTDGIAGTIASLLQDGSLTPHVLLILLLASTVLLTQVLNHTSTAIIMTPLALQCAEIAGLEARPFLMAVVTGASLAFLSPVAHQANAMIMGPGNYKYRDFLRVGTPLAILLSAVAAFMIPLMWPFVAA
ncbi:MAG TPA: SLC13 family permease [Planctomycetes bacterium]|nr:SLC13 family permease [Planctomycetota bacterium]